MAMRKQQSPANEVEDPRPALWQAYVDATQAAQASLRMEDGFAAGKAWAAFMNAFLPVPTIQAGVLPRPVVGGAR